jgi:hypothetical protein
MKARHGPLERRPGWRDGGAGANGSVAPRAGRQAGSGTLGRPASAIASSFSSYC